MTRFFTNKVVRLVLAFTVSIWMAGGCFLSCGSSAMAATPEAGESCHAVARKVKQPVGYPSFVPGPREMMIDCPLAVNATAATSKSSMHASDPGRIPATVLPSLEKQTVHADNIAFVSFLPNRGPTHLRHCVFLI